MSRRRIGRVAYLAAFIAIQQFTTVFDQYPLLELLGIVGVAIVGLDALVCSLRRWRSMDATLFGDDASTSE
ncbi:hypothetical protein [Halorhabdus amylolytica]|uniref:hypothetical protein n=1 Tax=Halorhabdus amylolytica TaxID=2559573 RepID=UPI0010AADEDF|nr:hypothetical protein [Halorhabdus amylolytica]